MNKKILITGMSGVVGAVLRRHLEKKSGYELSALTRRKVNGVKSFQGDISDLESIKPAFLDQDVVVHLAAYLEESLDSEEFSVSAEMMANVVGTYNVFEAARLAGVKRVVFASSGSTIKGFESEHPYNVIAAGDYDKAPSSWDKITHNMSRPDGTYGAAKLWGEALARYFSDEYDMSVLCVRIGRVVEENRPRDVRDFSAFLSHQDAGEILHKCIEAPSSLKYDVFFATSDNKWGYRDLDHPRDVLGFVPKDSAEAFR